MNLRDKFNSIREKGITNSILGTDDSPDSSETADQLSENTGRDYSELREEISNTSPAEIEQRIRDMSQQKRIDLVKKGVITEEKMAELRDHIESNPQLRKDWGLDGQQIETKEQQKLCATHEEPVRSRTADEQDSEKQVRENSYTEGKGGKVGGEAGVKAEAHGKVTDGTKTSAEQGNVTTSSRGDFDCSTGKPSCPLNRRAALNEMEFHAAANNQTEDSLRSRWERHGEKTSETETATSREHKQGEEEDTETTNGGPGDERESATDGVSTDDTKTVDHGDNGIGEEPDGISPNDGDQIRDETEAEGENDGIDVTDTQYQDTDGEPADEGENDGIGVNDTPNGSEGGDVDDGEDEGEGIDSDDTPNGSDTGGDEESDGEREDAAERQDDNIQQSTGSNWW